MLDPYVMDQFRLHVTLTGRLPIADIGLWSQVSHTSPFACAPPYGPGARRCGARHRLQTEIGRERGSEIAVNIDGATAVIFCELGFSPPLSRGLFCLSRSVGILAHGWRQMHQGRRNKGSLPSRSLPIYDGEDP